MTKNADTDKYKCHGYGTGFDLTGNFNHSNGGTSKNVIILRVDMTNSKHANNNTNDVLGRGLIQKIDDTTIYAEKMYSVNFTVANKTFCLSLHYNGDDSYLFVNGKEDIKFKAKNQSVSAKLFSRNISADFNQAGRKSTGLYGYVYDFSVDYQAIVNDEILDIYQYLMKKNNIV